MAINYKSLILETKNADGEIDGKASAIARKKPEIIYTIDGVSGPDIVITKKSARKEEQLIMLVSQNQLYVKDLKSANITMMTPKILSAFLDGLDNELKCEDAEGNRLNWTNKFYKGAKFAKVVCKLLGDENARLFICKGLFSQNLKEWREEEINFSGISFEYETIKIVYECVPERLKEAYVGILSERMLNYYSYHKENNYGLDKYDVDKLTSLITTVNKNIKAHIIYSTYGLDSMRKFIVEFFRTAVSTFPDTKRLETLILGKATYSYFGSSSYVTNFDFELLVHYLFYSSVEQGFANQISNFLDIWKDCLSMENVIYKHGINDKYPQTLATTHQILSYKYGLLKQKIDEKLWKKHVAKMSKYERHGEKYIIISPKTPEDMIDESRQQSNCLSSYVRHVINGYCMIFFLRETKNPEKSLVTIEVTLEGKLGQVKAKYNREPSEEQRDYINRWYIDKFVDKNKKEDK